MTGKPSTKRNLFNELMVRKFPDTLERLQQMDNEAA
jgi:hypothetical protein